ncbi:MAG: lipid-A-disaccharide synthase [Magnetococcales bacterium]|nr:lipid-A-disaccharide synthase [Magnetococcales bacterium]
MSNINIPEVAPLPPQNIVIVAGEASGDLLGGALLAQLKQRHPNLAFAGVGGPRMQEQGLKGPYDVNDLSVIGIVEVIKHLPGLIRVFKYLTALLRDNKPQLLVTIDLPDFNFFLAGRAKALGIPIVHYVSPQVWAWRSGRIKKIARLVNHLMVLFPFETTIYSHTKLPVTFVGHPLVEQMQPWCEKRDAGIESKVVRKSLGVGEDEKLLVILPGSRQSELKLLLPTMLETFNQLYKKNNKIRCVLAQADTISDTKMDSVWPTDIELPGVQALKKTILVRKSETYSLLMAADAALVASGTATLETALLGTPMVVMYRFNKLTYELGRRIIKVPYFALANLVAEKKLVDERLQDAANPTQLAKDLDEILNNDKVVAQIDEGYRELRAKLSHPSRLPVDVITDFLSESSSKNIP